MDECPHCGAELCMEHIQCDNDCATKFEFDCPKCNRGIGVYVEYNPTFNLKPLANSVDQVDAAAQ